MKSGIFAQLCALTMALAATSSQAETKTLLNVSYDPTREFYQAFNKAFAEDYANRTGITVNVRQSHGGAGKQARAVIDGLPADVLTLALSYDIDAIAEKTGLLDSDWQEKLAHESAPYTSTIVFLVRKGNPKHIRDWDDLIDADVQVVTPNPKTSGGARWNFLAAWSYAIKHYGDENHAKKFVNKLYSNVPVLDSGARGATNTFVRNGIGDVLLSWENEALLATQKLARGSDFEIVVPSISILAQPSVALVDERAKAHGVSNEAKAYLNYLYSPVGQQLAAKNFYRPVYPHYVDAKDLSVFPDVALVTINEQFNGWKSAQQKFFSDGGIFDQIYTGRNQ